MQEAARAAANAQAGQVLRKMEARGRAKARASALEHGYRPQVAKQEQPPQFGREQQQHSEQGRQQQAQQQVEMQRGRGMSTSLSGAVPEVSPSQLSYVQRHLRRVHAESSDTRGLMVRSCDGTAGRSAQLSSSGAVPRIK